MGSKKSFLRDVIGEYLNVLGEMDEKVVVVNADLSGTSRNKSFAISHPSRTFNVGIAEQNMVSFAAGLAHEGFKAYAFSMAPFLTMRACEQCRTDVAYANVDVRLMGVYAGVSGGISGATHWGIEDCGIMCSMPNIKVFEPCDANQAKSLLSLSLNCSGPMYIRSSVEPTLDIYDEDVNVRVGGSIVVRDGDDGAILCSGVTVQYALEAAEIIYKNTGKCIRVVDMYCIKPLDVDAVISATKTKHILVAQDHNVYGGLGSMVAKVIAENGYGVKFRINGVNDSYVAMAHAPYLYRLFKLDSIGIEETMMELLKEDGKGE